MQAGVLPVMKHVPGHGRAAGDSHLELPRISATHNEMSQTDFLPFKALADLPLAMTAHLVYEDIDPELPATFSTKVIENVIRGEIGFDGLLMTDDLSMKALSGSFRTRTERALKAGCDLVLHCNGDMGEMKAVAEGASSLEGTAKRRADAALGRLQNQVEAFDVAQSEALVNDLLSRAAG